MATLKLINTDENESHLECDSFDEATNFMWALVETFGGSDYRFNVSDVHHDDGNTIRVASTCGKVVLEVVNGK